MTKWLANSASIAALVATVVLPACGDGSPSAPADLQDVPIRTDRNSYVLAPDASGALRGKIPYTYRNPTDETIYLVNCLGYVALALQQLVGDRWVEAWAPVYPSCLGPPIVIAPGAAYQDTVTLYHAVSGHPRFASGHIGGTYRIVWSAGHTVHHHHDDYAGGSWGEPLPLHARVSNPFVLHAP